MHETGKIRDSEQILKKKNIVIDVRYWDNNTILL